MDTTTITAFWDGFTSTTIQTIFSNNSFFGTIIVTAVTIFVLGALYLTITAAARGITKRRR